MSPVPDNVDALERLRVTASTCTLCPLAKGRTQVVFGVGSPTADLLFVGEGPGREEDLAGEPFVGRSGKLLDRLMWEEVGLTRAECYIANVVKCRPPQNRDPAPKEIEACRPYLAEQIELIDPRVIVTLGNFATKLLLETTKGIRELRGQVFERGRASLVPTYHPAYVLRAGGEAMAEMRADLVRAKRVHGAGSSVTWPVRWTSESPGATRELAGRVAQLCRPGDVVLLVGDLGAGKTVFAQGFAAGLGVPGPVTSPTFALVRQYRCGGDSPVGVLIHADVYRTGSLDEVIDLALAELVEEDAVALVEWGELAAPALGDSALEITLVAPDPLGAPERRVLTLVGRGRWADRSDAVAALYEGAEGRIS